MIDPLLIMPLVAIFALLTVTLYAWKVLRDQRQLSARARLWRRTREPERAELEDTLSWLATVTDDEFNAWLAEQWREPMEDA